jgi:hypothetical protein
MLGLLLTSHPGGHALAQSDSGEVRGRVQNTYRSSVALIPISWCSGAVTGTTDLTGKYRLRVPAGRCPLTFGGGPSPYYKSRDSIVVTPNQTTVVDVIVEGRWVDGPSLYERRVRKQEADSASSR